VAGGFSYSGQSCIAVQRIFVQRAAHDAFLAEFLPRVRALVTDHPLSESADLSSMIGAAEAARVAGWLDEARRAGARVLCGGRVHGHVVEPTVLAGVPASARVNAEEVFAPVVTVQPYDTFEESLALVNAGRFGLQAGVFTRDRARVMRAFEALEVGGVMIDETPTWRLDPMPYGGIKDSGFGREGLRWAIEEMTEPRLLALPADLA
jgi:acyl-CoA reductase-like NAD-dependent aldehyde dehydrogenase